MQQLYETVCREEEWIADGCPQPIPQSTPNISETELRQIFSTGFDSSKDIHTT